MVELRYIREVFKEFESHELQDVEELLNILLFELGEGGFYCEMPSYWAEVIKSAMRGRGGE